MEILLFPFSSSLIFPFLLPRCFVPFFPYKSFYFVLRDFLPSNRHIFCDFGPAFMCVDVDGEQPKTVMIASISNEEKGVVTCLDEHRHDLEDGDFVTFSELKGS